MIPFVRACVLVVCAAWPVRASETTGAQAVSTTDAARAAARESIEALGGVIDPTVIQVRFKSGAERVDARDGRLILPRGLVAARNDELLQRDGWRLAHHVAREELDRQRAHAEAYWGRALPDLSQEFRLTLRPGETVEDVLTRLNTLGVLEYALALPLPAVEPLPDDYAPLQRYLGGPTEGINAASVWSWPGGTGAGIRICDIEYDWVRTHADLPAITILGPNPIDPDGVSDHGTAVLGAMLAVNNGWGVTGACYGASGRFAGSNTAAGYNVGAAITVATAGLRPGDVMLIEQQTFTTDLVLVPAEWLRPTYDAIVQAVGNGICVVEAAGNGDADLDSASFRTGNNGHWPFLAANDSGALLVGAGSAPPTAGGSAPDRTRLAFSNYGSTVDLHGWGERVTTAGYGDLYRAEGTRYFFTSSFSGTSSASPMVAAACVLLQSIHRAVRPGEPALTPAEVKLLLRSTGQAQAAPALQNIGPRPDVVGAAMMMLGGTDCNANGVPDAVDIHLGLAQDFNDDGVPDECAGCVADWDGSSGVDGDDVIAFFGDWDGGAGDVNGDGATDSDDTIVFLSSWDAGC